MMKSVPLGNYSFCNMADMFVSLWAKFARGIISP